MTSMIYNVAQQTNFNSQERIQKGIQRQTFENIYQDKLNRELKLSNHAQKRLEQRNLQLESTDLSRINEALDNAASKGANESLVIYKDLMLIASVRNRTIITAMEQTESKTSEEIFTNIDSAIIIK
ncbi:MAG TPA: hypothetical protein DCY20_03375 [Firmicutes bacterium]|nr:hypothetical protein [Bacillota bacterium]